MELNDFLEKYHPDSYGNLSLIGTHIKTLPEGLTIRGNLNLSGTPIKTLPEGLTVGGDLHLSSTSIESLPKELTVGGGLYMPGTSIRSLPEGLDVGGNLYLAHAKIDRLPEGLNVIGNLNLYHTPIKTLPEGLTVGGDLNLQHTPLKSLPKELTVGGSLDLYQTYIKILPKDLVIGGSLDLCGTKIEALPEGFTVGGNLLLTSKQVKLLPKGLTVGWYLNIGDASIRSLPSGVTVGAYSLFNGMQGTPEGTNKIRRLPIGTPLTWRNGRYMLADGIFSEVLSRKGNTYKVKRIGYKNTEYLVTDGQGSWSHGNTLRDAYTDLAYKIGDRDTSPYAGLPEDHVLTRLGAIKAYRTITGACVLGTRHFVESIENIKDEYTIREIIELTRNQYGNKEFESFFKRHIACR